MDSLLMLNLEQGKKLIELAHHAVETFASKEELSLSSYKDFADVQPIALILYKGSEIREAYIPDQPLYKAIVRAARQAAFEHPRYAAIGMDDMKNIRFEIALLTPPEVIKVLDFEDFAKRIRLGIDGLMIRAGTYSAIMLPDFPIRYSWDHDRALRYLTQKAGMHMDAWQNLANKIYKFQAQIFSEEDGKTVQR
jgi:uncharacterized protein (TIGR00296 family)